MSLSNLFDHRLFFLFCNNNFLFNDTQNTLWKNLDLSPKSHLALIIYSNFRLVCNRGVASVWVLACIYITRMSTRENTFGWTSLKKPRIVMITYCMPVYVLDLHVTFIISFIHHSDPMRHAILSFPLYRKKAKSLSMILHLDQGSMVSMWHRLAVKLRLPTFNYTMRNLFWALTVEQIWMRGWAGSINVCSHRARFLSLLCKKTLRRKNQNKTKLWTGTWVTRQRYMAAPVWLTLTA